MATSNKTLGNKKAAHLYEVEVAHDNGAVERWDVHANTRDQAGKLAKQWGVAVRSVNMVG